MEKKELFPPSLFVIYLGVLLLIAGIHTGLIVLMDTMGWGKVVQTVIPMVYWGLVALGLTLFTRKKIKDTYEEPLHRMAGAARKVSEGDFASNVSHEMKTPIAVMKNYAELLAAERIEDGQRKEYAKAVENAAARLSDLISNILKLNKLENQRIVPEMESYDICRQLCECILQFEDVWEERQIELETEIEDTAMVRADGRLLELVWNNLLGNALKFTEQGGSVTVRETSEAGRIRIAVSDTGCGMSRDCMDHIFDKFYQGDTSYSREGNGLGLVLVKRVLELMDGDIQVASREGEGSTFTVTLPAAET